MLFQTFMTYFLLLNTKEDILKNVGGSHWLPLYGGEILWKSMATSNCLVNNILQNILFCVQQNKGIHAGLEQQKDE